MLTSYSGLFKTSSLPSQVENNDTSGTEIRQKNTQALLSFDLNT